LAACHFKFIADTIIISIDQTGTIAIVTCVWISAGTGIRGGHIVVAGRVVLATHNLVGITNAVAIQVRRARAAANTQGVVLVAIAIAVARWNARATANATSVVRLARSIRTIIVVACTHIRTVVITIANAVTVRICEAITRAIIAGGWIDARTVIDGGISIVIACSIIGASGA
jgi:hypothetical protein